MKTLLLRNFPALFAALASFFTLAALLQLTPVQDCPAGQRLRDPVKRALEFNADLTPAQQAKIRADLGAGLCLPSKAPESATEIMAVHDGHYRKAGTVPQGAFRAAVAQKAAMAPLTTKVAGAGGTWQPYGAGNLVVGGGYDQVAARADNFAYDAVNKRLFVAIGTGGIWMSEAVGGDVRTLANRWVSVGEKLPSQIVSGVGWSSAGGGTLIAVGGESVMGSGGYLGLGGFWSTDLGQTWNQASGIPDAALTFRVAVDSANPQIVYAATSKGLFRSGDAGRTYVNARLPTVNGDTDCAGVEALGPCQFTNYVTDVIVKEPGGASAVICGASGCPVIAAVGFRTGSDFAFQDGRRMAGANGLYRSESGAQDTFTKLDVSSAGGEPVGFTAQNRIGRIELGAAVGPEQDHNYLYAIVQDAVQFNAGYPYIDAPADTPPLPVNPPVDPYSSTLNGIYASPDFGDSWIRMADAPEIANNPNTGTALAVNCAIGYCPGVQAWYNAWIQPDPTRTANGVPTRLAFGLEEVWQNRDTATAADGISQQGPDDFKVIGSYSTGTHPDQHAGLYVPTGDGGVCLFAGNDGGVFRQCADTGAEMSVPGWGGTATNKGIYALLPYGLGVSGDGTVWFGLQDNGSGSINPRNRRSTMHFGADGFYAETDPANSKIAYTESQNAGMVVTTDGGGSSTGITPDGMTNFGFDNFFTMDPTDARHLATGGQEIFETTIGEAVRPATWTQVFVLGSNPETGTLRRQTTIDLEGAAAYVGFCGACGLSGNDTGFANGIATNVGGNAPPKKASPDGWHFAAASGLPGRFISGIEIDPADARTIYVAIGGYYSGLRPPGSYLDPNTKIGSGNIFKSTDAGETFRDISSNLPGVAANSVLLRGGQLLIGTDVGAFISSDAEGSTWAPLGSGLPNVPVTMLRLRPDGSNQLFASTFGRHVWVYPLDGASPGDSADGDSYSIGGAVAPGMLMLLGLVAVARIRRRSRAL